MKEIGWMIVGAAIAALIIFLTAKLNHDVAIYFAHLVGLK